MLNIYQRKADIKNAWSIPVMSKNNENPIFLHILVKMWESLEQFPTTSNGPLATHKYFVAVPPGGF